MTYATKRWLINVLMGMLVTVVAVASSLTALLVVRPASSLAFFLCFFGVLCWSLMVARPILWLFERWLFRISIAKPATLGPVKVWIEYEVDSYWTRHMLTEGASIGAIARAFPHRQLSLSCIGLYTGPKSAGEDLDLSDIPFMAGYRDTPGTAHYYNTAKKK